MSKRLYNFSAGPAALPLEVLEASARGLVNFEGKGVGIAEVSHRGKLFDGVREECEALIRKEMAVPADYEVLFLQGGATQQFELIPQNFLYGHAEYVVTGEWATKAYKAAKRYGEVRCLASSESNQFDRIPSGWIASESADYLHICTNNTIYGTRFSQIPAHPKLIADMSSEIASRVIDVSQFAMIYAGAQKNLGPSGLVLVLVRKDFLAGAKADLPPIFSYQAHAKAQSCLNTPPTFSIYMLLEMMRWIGRQGGIAAIEAVNEAKANLLYGAIDGSNGFYTGTVSDHANRSRMNVTYRLPTPELDEAFVKQATARGLDALKGYRSVGGIRASIYNAMPLDGVQALVDFMAEFRAAAGR